VDFSNLFDELTRAGKDAYLEAFRQIPRPFDTSGDPDAQKDWVAVALLHWRLLDLDGPFGTLPGMPELYAAYWNDPDPVAHFGLPMSVAEYSNSVVVRLQRAVFQYWKEDVPWAPAGYVTVVNGGDISKELGFWTEEEISPEFPPARTTP